MKFAPVTGDVPAMFEGGKIWPRSCSDHVLWVYHFPVQNVSQLAGVLSVAGVSSRIQYEYNFIKCI